MGPMASPISKRKDDHLRIAASGEAAFRNKTTLLEEVELIHCALPDRHLDEVDLTTPLFKKILRAPLMISGMTGGTARAKTINRDLARVAETLGIAFGLGSQRPMLQDPRTVESYQVRDIAPTTLIFANLGLMQARDLETKIVLELVRQVDADVLCLHLNPAMELIQSGGDRDFRKGLDTIRRICQEIELPVVIKETGCGLSKQVAHHCKEAGVAGFDASGAGGTSWVGVETKRSKQAAQSQMGDWLWDWGIPTAASVAWLAPMGLPIVATGGLRTALDISRAMALGATVGGLAAPVLQAYTEGGHDQVLAYLQNIIDGIRAVTLLTGCGRSQDLIQAPKQIGISLQNWMQKT